MNNEDYKPTGLQIIKENRCTRKTNTFYIALTDRESDSDCIARLSVYDDSQVLSVIYKIPNAKIAAFDFANKSFSKPEEAKKDLEITNSNTVNLIILDDRLNLTKIQSGQGTFLEFEKTWSTLI